MSNTVLQERAETVSAPAAPAATTNRWLILAVILAAECMDLLDGTIVNVASPSVRNALHTSLTELQWIVGGYALTFAVGLVVGGRLGDLYGRRRLFLVGIAGFTLSSVLCGIAGSAGELIAFRLLQGAFAAIMIPQGFGIVRASFPKEEIAKAFGMFGPVIGGAAVLGPILGGALVDGDLFGLGWRAIFLVNAPVGILAFIAAMRLLPESRLPDAPRLDVTGAILVTGACALLILPLIQGREAGWPAWTFVSMAASIVVFVAFALHEARRERTGRSPLIETSVLRTRAYSVGLLVALVFFGGMIGLMLTMSLYLQIGEGFSAIHAGLTFTPWAVGTAIGAGIGAGALGPKIGRPVLHGGLVVMAVGVAATLLVVHGSGGGVSSWALAGPQLVAGAGMGAVLAPLFGFVLAGVRDHEVGSASGVLNAVQQLSAALGIAAIGTIFFSVATRHGLVSAFETALWIELGLLVVSGLLVFALPMRMRPEEELYAVA
jgi:EmrB/QacA subfamily drug resistance transporter